VPLILATATGTSGLLTVYNLTYNLTLNDLWVNGTGTNTYLETCIEDCDVPVNTSNSAGIIEYSDLVVRYAGTGNFTVNCTGEGYTDNMTMLVRYSPYFLDFVIPALDEIVFNPYTNNSKNVSAYGQISTRFKNQSLLNYTSAAQDHHVDLIMKTNTTLNQSQYNFTFTNVSVNDKKLILTSSMQTLFANTTNTSSHDIYVFLDLFDAVNYPTIEWWNLFLSYCSDEGDGYGGCVRVD